MVFRPVDRGYKFKRGQALVWRGRTGVYLRKAARPHSETHVIVKMDNGLEVRVAVPEIRIDV